MRSQLLNVLGDFLKSTDGKIHWIEKRERDGIEFFKFNLSSKLDMSVKDLDELVRLGYLEQASNPRWNNKKKKTITKFRATEKGLTFFNPKLAELKKLSDELYDKLCGSTQNFRDVFMTKRLEYATLEFKRNNERIKKYKQGDYKALGSTKGKAERAYFALSSVFENENRIYLYIEKNLKDSKEYFDSSLQKLAYKIIEKGFTFDTGSLKIVGRYIGNDIEATIKDNKNKVNIWTTLVLGDIQTPHYRFYMGKIEKV